MADNQKVDDDLYSLGRYKDIMMDIFYQSEDIRNLTMPVLDDARFDLQANFFGGKELAYSNPDTGSTEYVTLPGHCFDVPYLDQSLTEERAVILLESLITRIEGPRIKEVEIDVYALSHKSFIHLSAAEKSSYLKKGYSGNRVDMMAAAIELAVKERAREFGIGKIRLNSQNPILPYETENSFYGKKLSFLCSDFFMKTRNQR